ncbi:hypothetical protein DUNSADRAFT_8142, partial [Dunaliella salina]
SSSSSSSYFWRAKNEVEDSMVREDAQHQGQLVLTDGRTLSYDYLVIATGSSYLWPINTIFITPTLPGAELPVAHQRLCLIYSSQHHCF